MIQQACRYFSGYKPCAHSASQASGCSESCSKKDLIQTSLLIIHLGALGAVVRSTALLKSLKTKFPNSLITWITDRPCDQLLKAHPLLDRVLTCESSDILELSALAFDFAFVIDKSLKASGVLKQTSAKRVFGFTADPRSGSIRPATDAAEELWALGLDNQQKFFINQKSEIQLTLEALELIQADQFQASQFEYNLPLSETEEKSREGRRQQWTLNPQKPILGLNTGCGSILVHKKLSVSFQRQILAEALAQGWENIVLLGGPEDRERNQDIGAGLPVFQSAVDLGLRDGLVSVAATDLVLTGDSLGMHMAISQAKFVVAWFGPSCAQEIELYGRGVHLKSHAACAPCWKRSCDKTEMCYDQVRLQEVMQALNKGHSWWMQKNESSSSRLHF